jgi:phosphatidylserine/phosphatidylglycerophosphate/cardiolipin synthase-like enzyme
MMKRIILVAIFLLTLAFSGVAYESSLARVTDISDRAYESAVIKLLDGAKKSIVISMYTVSLGTQGNNPIRLLLNDLVEARGRGVEVTLYLNTKFKGSDDPRGRMGENEALKKLEDVGCVVHLLSPHRRLHDKLIVVDSRYVVDGSTNWSLSALFDNYESATLIDSPGLADVKLTRLKALELEELQKAAPVVHAPIYAENLPAKVNMPALLVTDKMYLPLMVSHSGERAMDLYLLLLALQERTGEAEAFIDLESMALSIGLPQDWDDTALRRQAIKSLKKLENNYGLVEVTFFHSKNARVRLTKIVGEQFLIDGAVFTGQMSAPARFYLIAKAYLASKGENVDAISDKELAKRFGLYGGTITMARKELSAKKGNE